MSEKNTFRTPSGLNLLKDWNTGAGYEAHEETAKQAAGALLRSGCLEFIHGDKPRTAAEFFDGMPYTSTSDFAAVWACCNWEIKNKYKPATLDGIAIDENGRAVAVWTLYDENGDEIGTDYTATTYENEAREFCEAIKQLANNPAALENLQFYLSKHFAIWLEKWANTPAEMAGELKAFSKIEF